MGLWAGLGWACGGGVWAWVGGVIFNFYLFQSLCQFQQRSDKECCCCSTFLIIITVLKKYRKNFPVHVLYLHFLKERKYRF